MGFEDSRFQKSTQINKQCMRKLGPKKGKYAEWNENGDKMEPKWEPQIVKILKNARKKASQHRCEKRVPNGKASVEFAYRTWPAG